MKFGYNPGRVGNVICPCCNQNINTEDISLCYDTTNIPEDVLADETKDFKLLSGVSLFFSFIKMLIVYLLFRAIFTDVFNMVSSYIAGKHCREFSDCQESLFTSTSGYNKYRSDRHDLIIALDVLNLVTIILSIPFFLAYRRMQYKLYDEIDAVKQTEDDYTLFIENIPILNFPDRAEGKTI